MKPKSKRRQVAKQSHGPGIQVVWILLILGGLGLIAYWNSFDAPLVFDDLVSIQKNEGVRFGDYVLSPTLLSSRGLLYMTFAANYLIHGQQVWGYHLVNLVLHLLNGFLIFFIAVHIFRKVLSDADRATLFGFFAAAVFLVHPVQTESVTYISSRSELLSTFFYALAFLIFIKTPDSRVGFLLSLIVAVPFLLGLVSKETVITLPATFVLYDFIFRSDARIRPLFQRWRFYVPFLVGGVLAVYYLATKLLVGAIGAQEGHLHPYSYFLTQMRVIVRYVQIVFLPVGLNVDYDFRPITSIFGFEVLGSLAFLLSLVVLAWYLRRKQPVISFAIFWFFITLSPTSSFVPILDVAFEHRLYLPLVAVCLIFPVVLYEGVLYVRRRWEYNFQFTYCCAAVLLLFTTGTILRNQIWRDDTRLWSDVIVKSPGKVRGYAGLCMAYYKRGEFDRALEVAQRGMKAVPEDLVGFKEIIGNMNLRLQRYDEAVQAFTDSAQTPDKRRQTGAYNNVGTAYLYLWQQLKGRQAQVSEEYFRSERSRILGSAAKAYLKSVELQPDMFAPLDSYINVMFDDGHADRIVPELQTRFGKDDYRAVYAVGKAAFLQGDYGKASEYLDQAAKLYPREKLIFFNHAYALRQLKQYDAAIAKYLQALRLDPLFVEAHYNVALLYTDKNDLPQALDHLQDALRMDPVNIPAHLQMAMIYMRQGNRNSAREHLSVVLNAAPGNQQAASLWQQLGS